MKSLFYAAKHYIDTIEQIEKTADPFQLQKLEEQRVIQPWQFIELLKKQGIKFKDREHATHIAFKIAKGDLWTY